MNAEQDQQFHPILKRQLKKLGLSAASAPSKETWQDFLVYTNSAYQEGDKDRNLLEHSLDISSQEMQELFEQLQKSSESRIAQERNKLEAVINSLGEGLCALDKKGYLLFINPRGEALLGWQANELQGRSFVEATQIDIACEITENPSTKSILDHIREGKYYYNDDAYMLRKDGTHFSASFTLNPLADYGAVLVFRDISERKESERKLLASEAKFRTVVENSLDGICELAPDGTFKYLNPILRQAIGDLNWQERNFLSFIHPRDRDLAKHAFEDVLAGKKGRLEVRTLRTKSLPTAYLDVSISPEYKEGKIVGAYVFTRDITQEKYMGEALYKARNGLEERVKERTLELEDAKGKLEEVNERLAHDSSHDALTNIPNRKFFMEKLAHTLTHYKANDGKSFAVLFLDLDRFKFVNDSLGHPAGDKLLVAISKRLATCLRPYDTVARLGGDEFTLLLTGIDDVNGAINIANRIQKIFLHPFQIDGHKIQTSASIGIVFYKEDYLNPEDMLRDADIAMYCAKELGKSCYAVFNESMRENAITQMTLENNLRGAIERKELQVFYQPIMTAESRELTGFEALVRWNHPKYGIIAPVDFIDLAEETSLIVNIDRWVLHEACQQMSIWQKNYATKSPLQLNVNISSRQFAHPGFVEYIDRVISKTGFDPCNLRLEITESMLVSQSKTVESAIEDLKQRGIQLHIDDFGTGYSSLGYLQRFPVDALKIDRSFVKEIAQNNESNELVKTIILMAKNLGIKVVAEGVETNAQLNNLKALGCGHVQGYLFSKPISSAEVETFLEQMEPSLVTVSF